MIRTATVVSGPEIWLGKSGAVLFMDLDWIVVEIVSKDSYGMDVFNVRFPIGYVKVVQELAIA